MSWIPAITTTGLLAAALWLLRKLISNRLKASVEFEFNQKIESLRSEIRQKESQIDSLRSHLLSGAASSKTMIEQRKLDAIDTLWQAISMMGGAKAVAMNMSVIKIDAVGDMIETDDRLKDFFSVLGMGFKPEDFNQTKVHSAKPYLSANSWAIYSAITAILSHSILHWTALKNGLDSRKFVKGDEVTNLIAAAAPEHSDYVTKCGDAAYYYLLSPLEEKLLDETRRVLAGAQDDEASIKRAGAIVEAAAALFNPESDLKDMKTNA